jgi:Kelch motif/Galactose oxidase, central domain
MDPSYYNNSPHGYSPHGFPGHPPHGFPGHPPPGPDMYGNYGPPPPYGDFGPGGMPPGGMPPPYGGPPPFGGMHTPPPDNQWGGYQPGPLPQDNFNMGDMGITLQNNIFDNILKSRMEEKVTKDEIRGSFDEPETDRMGHSLMATGYGHYGYRTHQYQDKMAQTVEKPKKNVSLERPDSQMPDYLYNLMYHQYFMFFQFRSNQVLNFDLNSALWHKKDCQGMYNKEDFRVALLPDYSFMITGGVKNGNVSSEAWLYDEGTATQLENMNHFRKDHTTIYNAGYVYVFGGSDVNGEIGTVERYSLRSKHWEKLQNLTHPRKMASVCNFEGDRIIIAGGFNSKHKKELDSVEILNTKTGTISMQSYAIPEALLCSSMVQINPSEVLIMGGFNSKGISNRVHVFNIQTGKYVKRGNLEDPAWSIYQPIFRHGWFYIFRSGRENQGVPDVQYYCLS